MRGTWNPTRRNRNIGTSKAGHGDNNNFDIPDSYRDSRIFWEKVDNYSVITKKVNDMEMKFIIEPTKKGYSHCCTIDDITYLISHLPSEDTEGIGLFIFRQPKRKESIFSSVWGRLGFNLSIDNYVGPGIIIEAVDVTAPIYWNKSLTPDKAIELERLKEDGHKITLNKREYIIEVSVESARATQMYRTILHELGHWKQWRNIVIIPSEEGIDELRDKYFSIPEQERETFANRYADEIRAKLITDKIIPYERIGDLL